jgi:hypothetical protein
MPVEYKNAVAARGPQWNPKPNISSNRRSYAPRVCVCVCVRVFVALDETGSQTSLLGEGGGAGITAEILFFQRQFLTVESVESPYLGYLPA